MEDSGSSSDTSSHVEQSLSALETPQGYATQIPISEFLTRFLPPLKNGIDPAKAADTLAQDNRAVAPNGRWRGFAKDPADVKNPRRDVFCPLEGVVRSIVRAAGAGKAPVSLYLNPRRVTVQGRYGAEVLPDAYLSAGHHLRRRWHDLIAFGELEKDVDIYDPGYKSAKRVTSSMARCMQGDPRRRFVFAFTIVDTEMRLWYGDRSQILVSESFNFITDHVPMIHFFLSLIFATPVEIGLDPTIVLLDDGQRYDITVRTADHKLHTYRTINILFPGDNKTLCYRGTRVWQAVKVVGGQETGKPVALKDMWVDPARRAEGDLIEEVCRAARDTEHRLDADSAFVSVECYGDVYFDCGQGHDDVLDCTRCHYEDRVHSREELLDKVAAAATDPRSPHVCRRRVHHRTVIREVCKSLAEEKSFTAIFKALARTALALQVMHSSGWVHRDVSKRNILLQQDGTAILSDFEYAKKVGDGDEIRIGTLKSMAVEVDAQEYRFEGYAAYGVPPALKERYPEKCAAAAKKYPIDPETGRCPRSYYPDRFQYNPLHDLESLWWIAVYYLVMKELVGDSANAGTGLAEEEGARGGLPKRLWKIVDELEALREALVLRYRAEELDYELIDGNSASGLHELFHDTFQGIAEFEESQGLTVRPITVDDPARYNPDSDVSVESLSPTPKPSEAGNPNSRSSHLWRSDLPPRKKQKLAKDADANVGVPDTAKRARPYLPRRAKMRRGA